MVTDKADSNGDTRAGAPGGRGPGDALRIGGQILAGPSELVQVPLS